MAKKNTEETNTAAASEAENKESLEEMLGKLEEIIKNLDADDIPLEEAFAQYSEGVKLVNLCNKSIDRVEKKVQVLLDDGNTGDFE